VNVDATSQACRWHIAQGSLHSAIRRIEPAPPAPPETMRPVEEPVYETPDPYLR